MNRMNGKRYQVSGSQGRFQPGSNDEVLENRLAITSSVEMDELELGLLIQLYDLILLSNLPERRLTLADLKSWHRQWLGNVYGWAGDERSVDMSKAGFMFAAVAQVPRLLLKFEQDCLARFTPCHRSMTRQQLIEAIAITHVELILIHPFREGNGRLSRLLADVMVVQAGHEPLDYSYWDDNKAAYIAAIHAGLACNYQPMQALVGCILPDWQDI